MGSAYAIAAGTPVPPWLDARGNLAARPCADYDGVPQAQLRHFCHVHGRYLLVTLELVAWLKTFIGNRRALEVGAGCGDLGRALGVPMVDNHQQQWPQVAQYYRAIKQPTIRYGADVKNRDANSAVRKWQPDVVLGAWITDYLPANESTGTHGGNPYGVREEEMLEHCGHYVLIGSKHIHQDKRLMRLSHTFYDAPFARSRRTDNGVWVWRGKLS